MAYAHFLDRINPAAQEISEILFMPLKKEEDHSK